MLRTFKSWVQMTPGQFLVCWCLLAGISSLFFQMHLFFFVLFFLSLKVRKLGGVGKENYLDYGIRPGAIFLRAYNSN